MSIPKISLWKFSFFKEYRKLGIYGVSPILFGMVIAGVWTWISYATMFVGAGNSLSAPTWGSPPRIDFLFPKVKIL